MAAGACCWGDGVIVDVRQGRLWDRIKQQEQNAASDSSDISPLSHQSLSAASSALSPSLSLSLPQPSCSTPSHSLSLNPSLSLPPSSNDIPLAQPYTSPPTSISLYLTLSYTRTQGISTPPPLYTGIHTLALSHCLFP